MTIYNKNGSLAVTIMQSPTTQNIQTINRTNSSSVASNVPYDIQLDDEDDFTARNKWDNLKKIVHILYNVNIAMAVIQSVVGLILFLTILDRKLREKSQMWYLYHLIILSVFIGLILHPLSFSGILYNNIQSCYFLMYGAEYAIFGVGMSIVLVNVEIYFTKILNLQSWESNPFYRFLVLILSGWLVVCLLIAHVIINNNSAKSKTFCFVLTEASVRNARVALRTIFPAALCFLCIIVSVVTYTLKRSRITFTTSSGELKEIRTEGRDDEPQWLMCSTFMNVVFIIREIAMMIAYFNSNIDGPDHYKWIVFIIFIHVQAVYTVPFCLFFIADVRMALKTVLLKVLEKVSFGKIRLGEDLENLSVSFGNISQDNS